MSLLLRWWLLSTGDGDVALRDVQQVARCADGQNAISGQRGGDGFWIYAGWDLILPVKLPCHNSMIIL